MQKLQKLPVSKASAGTGDMKPGSPPPPPQVQDCATRPLGSTELGMEVGKDARRRDSGLVQERTQEMEREEMLSTGQKPG